jgi:hypothetical protein
MLIGVQAGPWAVLWIARRCTNALIDRRFSIAPMMDGVGWANFFLIDQ